VIALVTGAAGFIGSRLVERLLADKFEVIGIDSFNPFYDSNVKRRNIQNALANPNFQLIQSALQDDALNHIVKKPDLIFHQAGQPGVQGSWGIEFERYLTNNVLATRTLLEYAKKIGSVKRFVAASSSSVYGDIEGQVSEQALPRPISPYGVTKLAAEHLCTLYGSQFGLETVSLRYFTVYGPRQRPDMAISRIIESAITGANFGMVGDGRQLRDFTFVDDVVEANLLAASNEVRPGSVFNVGGGSPVAIGDVISLVESFTGKPVRRLPAGDRKGDPRITSADSELARTHLNWQPKFTIEEGLQLQIKEKMGTT